MKAFPSHGFRPERIPLWLLLLALSTLFLCNVDRGYFYRPGSPNWNTAKNLAMAENLSPHHHFRLSPGLRPGPGDEPTYEMYSRFPVGGYALIKFAVLPFGNDLSARILAARMLMLLLFSAAAILAFHSLARIISHRWVALAATLTAFSSYYMLLYGNAVGVEYGVDLFAVMLVFHGMVVFVQEGRFRQLLARTCVALLLGWRVYAFLLPFLILGLATEAMGAWKDGTGPWPRVRSAAAAVLRSRYMALGVFALLFGAAVLGFNFANEYAAFGGERRVSELPSVQSMLERTGLDQDLEAPFDHGWWLRFLRQQFHRVRVASVPLALTDWGAELRGWFPSVTFSASGLSGPELWVYFLLLLMVVAASAAVVRLARRLLAWRGRMLLAVLALSGFFWSLPMRHNAIDNPHEGLYYVGVPLAFYSLFLLYVHKRWGRGPVVGLGVAALLAFVVSAFQMDRRWRPHGRAGEVQQAAMAELGPIRETTRGKGVLVLESIEPEWSRQFTQLYYGSDHIWRYYLAGSVLTQFPDMASIRRHLYPAGPQDPAGSVSGRPLDMEVAGRAADFIVSRDRVESDALLTPGNQLVFLYDSAGMDDLIELYRATYRRVVSGEPAARSYFDVYLGDGALAHVKDPCVREDVRYWIVVEVIPEDLKDLPKGHGRYGSGNRDFRLYGHPVLFEGKCIAVVPLPDYLPDHRISGIRTGQPHRHRGWEVEIPASR